MFERNTKNYGKGRRVLRVDRNDIKKSGNLRSIHKLLVRDSDTYQSIAQRSSAAQIIMNNRQSESALSHYSKGKSKKDSSVNFYINIDKLKNLKISGQDRSKPMSNFSSSKFNNFQEPNRKSLFLRNKEKDRKGTLHSSYDQNKFVQRASEHQAYSLHHKKNKERYRTEADDRDEIKSASQNKSYLLKKSNFKKNDQEVKDKTFIDGYLKGKQLGRGGFSKVWQGFNYQSKTFYAIKQIDTQNKYQTHLTEIWFGKYFFENGVPQQKFASHPGVHHLLTMYSYSIVNPRAFIVYEACDGSLGNMLYDIYEEEGKQDDDEQNRLYMIKYKKLYGQLKKSTKFLKCFIYEISQALDLLAENKIVHSDIKTENILIKHEDKNLKFKLIDYGSSFLFESLKQYKLATPEYMCPELLNFILFENKKEHYSYMLDYVKDYKNISGIDVWGLGCIVLELIHGLPLWLTNPTRMIIDGRFETKKGLFAVSDRSFSKILERQLYVVENLQVFLSKNNNSGIMIDDQLLSILKNMLNPNPEFRIRPKEIIKELLRQH